MRKLLFLFISFVLTLSAFAEKDKFAGFYTGTVSGAKGYPLGSDPVIYAEVFRGANGYRVKLLPAIMANAETYYLVDGLKEENGKLSFANKSNGLDLKGEITPATLKASGTQSTGKNVHNVSIDLKRLNFVSKTMGMKAPTGAVVIFDGKDTSKLEERNGKPCRWEVANGAMTVKTGLKDEKGKRIDTSIFTKDKFGAFKMHLEFMIPNEGYEKDAQARNNSGVIVGPYEVQILDSFGMPNLWNGCGAIYRQTAPQSNASIEQGAWQTYDIIFRPAEFANGRLVKYPTFTVWHNGIKIHNETPVFYQTSLFPTKAKGYEHPTGPFSIQLQDHTNPISFRNFWVMPL